MSSFLKTAKLLCYNVDDRILFCLYFFNGAFWRTGSSSVAQLVKNLPAMQETLVRFLGWEDPLKKG